MKKIIFSAVLLIAVCNLFSQSKKQKAILLFKDGKEVNCFARVAGKNIRYTENDIHETEKVVDEKDILGLKIYINEKLIWFERLLAISYYENEYYVIDEVTDIILCPMTYFQLKLVAFNCVTNSIFCNKDCA